MTRPDLLALARALFDTDEEHGWRSVQATAAYNALRDAVLGEPAAEADPDSEKDLDYLLSVMSHQHFARPIIERARARLAALEPLCRAAVEYEAKPGDMAGRYAVLERSQRWARDHGREFAKGMKP